MDLAILSQLAKLNHVKYGMFSSCRPQIVASWNCLLSKLPFLNTNIKCFQDSNQT